MLNYINNCRIICAGWLGQHERPTNKQVLSLHPITKSMMTSDLTSRDSKESNVSNKTGDAAPKSPKKKFLGISVPTFLSSNHVPIAPPIGVDSKALKVLGSSPPKRRKGRFSPHSPRAPKLSDSSKSLPGKVFDRYPPQYRRRHEIANYGSLARTRVRSPGRQSPTRSRSSPPRNGANDNPFERDDAVLPPTPPQKDTPERVKNRLLRDRQHKGNSTDAGMKMVHLPTMQLLEPRDSYGSSESPKKYCPKGAEDHAHLEHVEPVKSTYGVVEHTDTEVSELYTDEEGSSLLEDSSLLEGSSDPEDYRAFLDSHVPGNILPDSMLSDSQFDLPDPLQTPRVTRRRHSDLPLRTPVGALLTGRVQPEQLDFLKPTVYVPPPNDKRGGPFERFKKVSVPSFLPQSGAQHTNSTLYPSPLDFQLTSFTFTYVHFTNVMTQSDKIRLPLTILPKPLPSLEEDKQDPTRMTALHGNSNVSPPKAEHEENQVPTFAHRLMQPAHQIPNHSPYVNNATRPGPRPQSSSLTDMFDSMSLARIDSDNFRPSCLSAVPSPLRHGPDPSQPHPMGAHEYSRPKPSMAMDDHFFVTNEHIDVVACALWDKIAAQAKQQMDDSSKKHDKLLAVVDKHFEDFKVQISSINDQADRSATQVHNLNAQMHKTIEGIKKEVLSSVEAHTKRLTDMEQTVKELQKTVQDVQRMHEPNNAAAGYASPQGATNSFSLPNHSSQPSLAGYINSAGREPLSYQQQTHGYTEGHRPGNTSYMSRSAHVGREGKDDDNPFVRTNSYYPPSGVGGSSGFPQASQHHYDYSPHQEYQQYQNLQHHQQHYGANQGSTK